MSMYLSFFLFVSMCAKANLNMISLCTGQQTLCLLRKSVCLATVYGAAFDSAVHLIEFQHANAFKRLYFVFDLAINWVARCTETLWKELHAINERRIGHSLHFCRPLPVFFLFFYDWFNSSIDRLRLPEGNALKLPEDKALSTLAFFMEIRTESKEKSYKTSGKILLRKQKVVLEIENYR